MAINERRLASITYHLFNYYNNQVIAPVKTLSNSYHVIVCTTQGGRNEVMIYKREGREGSEARWRSELGAKEAALPVQEAERSEVRGRRSDVVGANVLQVVELQLQLTYSHVLGGQLLLQPPQLILLPEEHPQELRGERQTLTHETKTLQQAGVNGEEEHVANVQRWKNILTSQQEVWIHYPAD